MFGRRWEGGEGAKVVGGEGANMRGGVGQRERHGPHNPPNHPLLSGRWIGKCPTDQCCSQFGFCVNTTSYYCATPSCTLEASPASPQCIAAHAAAQPVVRKYKLVATWGMAAPDGEGGVIMMAVGRFFVVAWRHFTTRCCLPRV